MEVQMAREKNIPRTGDLPIRRVYRLPRNEVRRKK